MTTTTPTTTDRFLTVPDLIERCPIGLNSTYQLIKSLEFPRALVPLCRANGQPRCVFRSFRTPNPEFSYTSRGDRWPRSGRHCCEGESS